MEHTAEPVNEGAERGAYPITLDRERIVFFELSASFLLHKKYGPMFLLSLYRNTDGGKAELQSEEALRYFLWAGLQWDAKANGEKLSEEQVGKFFNPFNFDEITTIVTKALAATMNTPTPPGKTAAAAASPAVVATQGPGPTKVSTSSKRNASPTRRSTSRPNRSGR